MLDSISHGSVCFNATAPPIIKVRLYRMSCHDNFELSLFINYNRVLGNVVPPISDLMDDGFDFFQNKIV